MFKQICCSLLVASASLASALHLEAQQDAQALLKHVQAKAVATRSMSAQIVLTRRGNKGQTVRLEGTAELLKPNLAQIKLAGDDPEPLRAALSDGHDLYTFQDTKNYSVAAIDAHGAGIREPWWSLPLSYFFSQSLNPFGPQADPTATYKLLPDETRDGRTVHVIGVAGNQAMGGYTERITIDAADRIVASEVDFGSGPQAAFFKAELSDLKTGVALTPAAFRFREPAGAVRKVGTLSDLMLPVGETAPEFKLPALDGTQQTLATERAGAKATLVNFWFANCAPCRLEFPEFEKLYERLHAKGFNIAAIDKGDDNAGVSKVKIHDGLSFPLLLGGEPDAKSVFAAYRTTNTFPASYLVDGQGKIVWRSASVDVDGLTKALAAQGVQ